MIRNYLIATLIFLFSISMINKGYSQVTPLPNAHAHNDYEHEHPLYDALANGFTSVEADVYLIDDDLYVYHDRPGKPDPDRTLVKMYLEPLKKLMKKNGKRIYPGYYNHFFLMIDIKDAAEPTYRKIRAILEGYKELIAVSTGEGTIGDQPVRVFLSGNRPVKEVVSDPIQYAGIDGRPDELKDNIPAILMPVVSDNYRHFLSWSGKGPVNPAQEEKLEEFIREAHAQGKKVRLWAAPDMEPVWEYLLEKGVDLINTDRLEELRTFLLRSANNH